MLMHSQTSKEMFFVAGNQPDPTGGQVAPQARGLTTGHRFDRQKAVAHPMLHYTFGPNGETILEADVYPATRGVDGDVVELWVHLVCPHCVARGRLDQTIKISAANKAILFDPAGAVPTFPGWSDADMARTFPAGVGGALSIDRFRCTWEKEARQIGGSLLLTDETLCDFDVVIDKNRVRLVTAQGALR